MSITCEAGGLPDRLENALKGDSLEPLIIGVFLQVWGNIHLAIPRAVIALYSKEEGVEAWRLRPNLV